MAAGLLGAKNLAKIFIYDIMVTVQHRKALKLQLIRGRGKNMADMLSRAKEIEPEILKDRRFLHQNAELGDELPITTAYVKERLIEMGYEPVEICKSGVVATVGKGDKTFMLRADMDALPMDEISGLEFASTNGYCHSCGHDTHTAMLLGAAKLLKEREDELEGVVKLMFQPAEEFLSGARAMIEAGLLENPTVDAAMAIHISSNHDSGTIQYTYGGSHGSADKYNIYITGKGGHGASPHLCIDPVNAACHVVIGLNEILSREVDAKDVAILTVGAIQSGTKENIIPENAFITGTIRTKKQAVRDFMKQRLVELSTSIAEAFRCKCEVTFPFGVAPLENNAPLMDEVLGYTRAMLGDDLVREAEGGMGSEDFSLVTERVPGIFLTLGARVSDPESVYSMHNPAVLFDDSAFYIGAATYANTAVEWLKNNK